MPNVKITYIVQFHTGEEWADIDDCVSLGFAKGALDDFQKANGHQEFRIVKRTTTYQDEVIT